MGQIYLQEGIGSVGGGYNFKSGKLNIPVNIGFVPGRNTIQNLDVDNNIPVLNTILEVILNYCWI